MSLKVRMGPMFSGKSTSLQSDIRRHQAIGWRVFVITHSIDTRYSSEPKIINHDQQGMPALSDSTLMGFLTHPNYALSKLVVIEEAQFFPDLVEFVKQVVDNDKKHCIVVGLDGDSERKPFGQVLEVCAMAEEVVKFNALCKRCGNGTEAPFTYAHNVTTNSVSNICVGAEERYIPLCRNHYLQAKYPERSRTLSITHHGC